MALNATDLGTAMANAMDGAWQQHHGGEHLPSPVNEDGKSLFLAIATGILNYLRAHEADAVNSITLNLPAGSLGGVSTCTVSNVDVN